MAKTLADLPLKENERAALRERLQERFARLRAEIVARRTERRVPS